MSKRVIDALSDDKEHEEKSKRVRYEVRDCPPLSNEIIASIFQYVEPGRDRYNMMLASHLWNQIGYMVFFSVTFCRAILYRVIMKDKRDILRKIIEYHPDAALFNHDVFGLMVIYRRTHMMTMISWFPIADEELLYYLKFAIESGNETIVDFFLSRIDNATLSVAFERGSRENPNSPAWIDSSRLLRFACTYGVTWPLKVTKHLMTSIPTFHIIPRHIAQCLYIATRFKHNDVLISLLEDIIPHDTECLTNLLSILLLKNNLPMVEYILTKRRDLIDPDKSATYIEAATGHADTTCFERLVHEDWLIKEYEHPISVKLLNHAHVRNSNVFNILISHPFKLAAEDLTQILFMMIKKNNSSTVVSILKNKELVIPKRKHSILLTAATCNGDINCEALGLILEDGRIDPTNNIDIINRAITSSYMHSWDAPLFLLLKDGRIDIFDVGMKNPISAGKAIMFRWSIYLLLVNYRGYDPKKHSIACNMGR